MLSADGERFEKPCSKGFLFPIRALSKVYRGKFLDGLRQAFKARKLGEDETVPSLCHRLRQIDWVVYAKAPFGGPEQVLAYLGRYTHRIAIANHRLLSADPDHVAFHYRDYAEGQKRKVMRLETLEFIRRFSMHVLPKRFVRIRHYGLLANRTVGRRSLVAESCSSPSRPVHPTRSPCPKRVPKNCSADRVSTSCFVPPAAKVECAPWMKSRDPQDGGFTRFGRRRSWPHDGRIQSKSRYLSPARCTKDSAKPLVRRWTPSTSKTFAIRLR